MTDLEGDVSVETPEETSKARVRDEYELLVAQHDFFEWDLRLHDAGDYCVVLVRIAKPSGRVFLMRLTCDDYWQLAPKLDFLDPNLFETADEDTEPAAEWFPTGDYVAADRGPLPVLCIKGHRDFYKDGWHAGWTVPPTHDHALNQLVTNVHYAISKNWT
jgi:hypothetical protein